MKTERPFLFTFVHAAGAPMSTMLYTIMDDTATGKLVRIEDILDGECEAPLVVGLHRAGGGRGNATCRRAGGGARHATGSTHRHDGRAGSAVPGYVHWCSVTGGPVAATLYTGKRMYAVGERMNELLG